MKLKNIIEPFAVGYLNAEIDNVEYRFASGLLNYARYVPIYIYPENYFVGEYLAEPQNKVFGVEYHYANGIMVNYEKMQKQIEMYPSEREELEYIYENMKKLDTYQLVRNDRDETEKALVEMRACWGGNWGGHTNPDYADLLENGTNGIRKKIEKYRKINKGNDIFYDSLEMSLDAFELLAQRYCLLAYKMSLDKDGEEKAILERIYNCLRNCPKNPPRDFFEACQMFFLAFTFIGKDSPGRFDQYMIKYYRQSEEDDRKKCLDKLWELFKKVRAWNLCVGGLNADGTDSTNELSFAVLEVAAKYKYQAPNLTMRVHSNSPQLLIDAAVETISTGIGMPVLYNDDCVCKALQEKGISYEDSFNYCMNGCNQIDIMGKSHMGLEDGEVSLIKCLEFTLFNGECQYSHEKIGLETGNVNEFKTFEELLTAYKKQVEYITDIAVNMSNKAQEIFAKYAPNVFLSTYFEGCVEKAKGFRDGGPKYGNGQILAEGIADTVDSLEAIRNLVFEKKKYSMNELIEALKNDFKNSEELYYDFKNQSKFGNDEEYTNQIARHIVTHFFNYLLTKKTYRGGVFSGGCSPFNRVAAYGEKIGAMPNGKRKDDTLLADSIGAVPGNDINGPTALINSVLNYEQTLAGSGFVLNLKFNKDVFKTIKGKEAFKSIIKTYFSHGGQQISPSVVNSADLEDAVINPDKHRDLIVRVGGYSDYFVDLTTELQKNIIKRTLL